MEALKQIPRHFLHCQDRKAKFILQSTEGVENSYPDSGLVLNVDSNLVSTQCEVNIPCSFQMSNFTPTVVKSRVALANITNRDQVSGCQSRSLTEVNGTESLLIENQHIDATSFQISQSENSTEFESFYDGHTVEGATDSIRSNFTPTVITSTVALSNITNRDKVSGCQNRSLSEMNGTESLLIENQHIDDSSFQISQSENSTEFENFDDGHNVEGATDSIIQSIGIDYIDFGDPDSVCYHCHGQLWFYERVGNSKSTSNPKFSLCCSQGKIKLPFFKDPPRYLLDLVFDKDSMLSKHFRQYSRLYNILFCFTSMGGQIDRSVNNGAGPYSFCMYGMNYHNIGSLLPVEGQHPKFAQLYIFDTENEIQNRMSIFRGKGDALQLKEEVIQSLKTMLDETNVLAKSFRMARDRFQDNQNPNLKLKLIRRRQGDGRQYNLPTVSEVAALVVGDIDSSDRGKDIIVETQCGLLQRVDDLHPAYLPLQYPLLFPYGEDGYRDNILHADSETSTRKKKNKVTLREYLAFRLQDRQFEKSILLHSGRVFQQFIVDAYTMIENQRLTYVRMNQKQLRAELYQGLTDAVSQGERSSSAVGKRVVLPSSFTGGARYIMQNYQDAMAICKWAGYPDIFITLTCNPACPEITRRLRSLGLQAEDRPDLISRVFKMKVQHLIRELKNGNIFGRIIAVIYTIEFQKRGLPHAHILLFLHREDKYIDPQNLDNIICAEIPDKNTDPELYNAVSSFMMHGPCGSDRQNSPCMSDGRCTKFYPKSFVNFTSYDEDGFPIYRRRDDGRTIEKNNISLDNTFVVPYNPQLLLKYGSHMNVEYCNQSASIKYLFKYINKGADRITAALYEENSNSLDEIKVYLDCRYVSACESAWRIFGFDINYKQPAVERLSFHLPNQQTILFEDGEQLDYVINKPRNKESMFTSWMEANQIYEEAKTLTYAEFPSRFVYKAQQRKWSPRKAGFSIGRMFFVPPSSGELYYQRILLTKVKGPTNFDDIKTVNGVVYPSYRDACYHLGLLSDDREYIEAIEEAAVWGTGIYLRSLFVTMLISNSLSRPEFVWNKTWHVLSDDIVYFQRRRYGCNDLRLTDIQQQNLALGEIETLLKSNGRSLKDFPCMPLPDDESLLPMENRLIAEQLNFNRRSLAEEAEKLLTMMTEEQKLVFDKIIDSVLNNKGQLFFLYGYGGTGKTFIWNVVSSFLRSQGYIVLTVASSGIASTLLPAGRTAHSRFSIPLQVTDESTCNIKQGSLKAELILKTKLVIWDEAPMVKRQCIEAVDRTFRDILRSEDPSSIEKPFGGKSVVLGGDFRQILPVISHGSRSDIVHAAIKSSYLWPFCEVLTLTKNMRLHVNSDDQHVLDLREFSEWILQVGDGKLNEPNDGEASIDIPAEILISEFDDPMSAIVNNSYPNLIEKFADPDYLKGRAILTPTLDVVHEVNDYMLSLIPGELKEYFSSDSICRASEQSDSFEDNHPPEYLNTLQCSGLPNHKLNLKVGAPIMLLRNINQAAGLCNGSRLIITKLGRHVIEAKSISGSNFGQRVFISRMTLSPSETSWPFQLQRRQFPIIISYCMTINKSQGQSLDFVGVYLPRPVFTHGQLYVAVSRVKSKNGLKILIHNKENEPLSETMNVVYKEIF